MAVGMNGAESLVRTLVAGGATTCFSNPGTSEMHFVAALDRVDGMECVLCLFEGVATGAADGWARMTGRPGLTLLHLGPGLANGLANLHNAKKAMTPIVNVVGEHTTQHLRHEAPLTSDTEGVAWPMSHWVHTGRDSTTIAAEGAAAIRAARKAPGQIATLILPADTAWGPGGPVADVGAVEPAPLVDEERVRLATAAVRLGRSTLLLLGASAVRDPQLRLAGGIAARTGARIMGRTSLPRTERGVGHVELPRVPYYVDQALDSLKDVETIVLVGADDPISFFGYPGRPSRMAPESAQVITLAAPEDDIADALERLAQAVGASARDAVLTPRLKHAMPGGALSAEKATAIIAALLPEGAIVVDESVSNARFTGPALTHAAPHDLLQLTGGAIGVGPPMALGAAIACKDRKVINLEADGSAMYTLQALWSQARAKASVVTVIWANRAYAILKGELANVGAHNPGRKALDMISLDEPALDWVKLANGMGVPARRTETAEAFADAFRTGLAENGPFVIEAII